MTTVVGTGQGNAAVQQGLGSGSLLFFQSFTSTQIVIGIPTGQLTLTGTGFTYTQPTPSTYVPTGGTITGLTLVQGTQNQTWQNFSIDLVTAFNDVLDANAFNALFFGGDDTFTWTPGTNSSGSVFGYGGNDVFTANAGGAGFTGGSGTDTANIGGGYGGAPFPNMPAFSFGTHFSPINPPDAEIINLKAGNDYIFAPMYNFLASGNNVTIDGSALGSSNRMFFALSADFSGAPPTGNWTLIGGAGDDWMQAGSGNNIFNGGAGTDTVGFYFDNLLHSNGVTVDLSITNSQSLGTGWGTGTFTNIENIVGTGWNDTLTGNSANNVLAGGQGQDTLNGGAGWDVAVLDFDFGQYGTTITHNPDGSITLNGGYGFETYTNIEVLRFAGTFGGTTTFAVGTAPISDFNGTGQSDLLWQNSSGQAAVWLMNGATRTGAAEVGSNPGPSWHVKGDGDFNGDGNADILWQNDTGPVAIWFMNGTGMVSNAIVGDNPGTRWRTVGTGDFNGDGKADILFQNLDGSTAIWMMNGTSVGANGVTSGTNLGKGWQVAGVGDFNADTKADLVFQKANGDIAVRLMDGLGVLSTAILSPGDPNMRVKAVGDFDGDAKADILWQNSATGEATIWNMDGTTHTGGGVIAINPGTSWHVVGAGTFDTGNKNLDILWQNDNGDVAAWYMNNTRPRHRR